MTNEKQLQRSEERVAHIVSNVRGVVTKAEVDELYRLRDLVGRSWDAVNRKWQAWEDR